MLITAYYNHDFLGAGDGREHGIIIEKKDSDEVEFEFFKSQKGSEARAKEINDLETDDWNNI